MYDRIPPIVRTGRPTARVYIIPVNLTAAEYNFGSGSHLTCGIPGFQTCQSGALIKNSESEKIERKNRRTTLNFHVELHENEKKVICQLRFSCLLPY